MKRPGPRADKALRGRAVIKRTIEISQQPVHLTVKNDQLLIHGRGDERTLLSSVPCEDVGVLLVEEQGVTYTHAALERLLHHGAAVVICGRDHLPAGMALPVGEHSQVVPRIHVQFNASKPLRKQLWRQIIRAKIRAQADNLAPESGVRSRVLGLARKVRSGDPSNIEAQAARAYWSAWLDDPNFHRSPAGPPPNNLLNYAYAVLRAAVARAIVAAGLVPALGLHHHHRANAFALADDLLEPLRPIADDRVREVYRSGYTDLIPQAKRPLLELLTLCVRTGDGTGPLMVALHRYVASLVRCLEGTDRTLIIPVAAGAE